MISFVKYLKRKKVTLIFSFLIFSFFFSSFTESYSQYLGWRRVIDKVTFDVSVNPLNPNTYFAGGEGKRFYRSFDGGNNWDTVLIPPPYVSTTFNNVLIHPRDTNIVLVGGLNFNVILRSTNSGLDWDVVLSRKSAVSLNGKSMIFKPDQPDTAYLGEWANGIIFRSTNKGASWDSIGQLRRTVTVKKPDGSYQDSSWNTNVGATAIRHDSTNVLVFGTTSGEIFVSQDGGFNWKFMDYLIKPVAEQSDCEITRIIFSDRDPLVGYICITYLFLKNRNNGGVYKTTDGGYNWHAIAFPDTSIWALDCIGRGNDDEVFIGGYTEDFYVHDTMRIAGVGIVRRSQDGGKTWWSYDSGMNWALEYPKPNSTLESVYFPSPDTGFAVGSYGVVKRTTNGGDNWNDLVFSGKNNFKGCIFKDSRTGLVVDQEGFILKTVNFGINWNQVYALSNGNTFSGISKITPSAYLATTMKNGKVLKTTNEGIDWIEKQTPSNQGLLSSFFLNDKSGYISGMNGTILKTNDGGDSWTEIQANLIPTKFNLNSVCMIDSNTIYAVGDSGTCIKTTDNGSTWNLITLPLKNHLNKITISKGGTGKIIYIVVDNGDMIKSTDNGNSWNIVKTLTTRIMKDAYFNDDNVGVIVGRWGAILKTTDGGNSWSIPNWSDGPRANAWSLRYLGTKGKEKLFLATEAGLFVLDFPSYVEQLKNSETNLVFKVIPNNKDLKVIYNSNSNNNPILSIADINGRIIYTEDFQKFSGNHFERDILNLNLSHGAYICRLVDGDKSYSQIIIID